MTPIRCTRLLSLVGALVLLVSTVRATAAAPDRQACAFHLGFADVAALIPDLAGECLGDEVHSASGDALQPTTGGLLVWRKADNWTAFTDGSTTWINGPFGLQSRPNDQTFDWEAASPRPSGPLEVGKTWSEAGLSVTVQAVEVGKVGTAPTVTVTYNIRNDGVQAVTFALDNQQRLQVVDNLGRRYPLQCCVTQPQVLVSLGPGETFRAFAQFDGDASQPSVTSLTVTFAQVDRISNAQWMIQLSR